MGLVSPDYADMVEVIQAIIAACPDYVVWGSHWPQASISVPTTKGRRPGGDFLLAAAPDETTCKKILSEKPAKLYGWK
jgi:predicted TIM-barrel fold metal-dependent hydrolase